jgi:LEA14-like dessication related protein
MKCHRIEKVRVLLVALVLIAIAGCHREPRPQPPWVDVSISQISAGQMGVLEQTYKLALRVQNPNNFDINADGLSFAIEANGRVFAKGVSNQAVLIPRMGETLVQVQAISDFSKIAAQINSAQSIRNEGLHYRLVGRFFSGNERILFDYYGRVGVTQ